MFEDETKKKGEKRKTKKEKEKNMSKLCATQ